MCERFIIQFRLETNSLLLIAVLPYFLCAPWPAARPNELPLLNTMLGTNVQLGTVAPLPSPNLVNEPQEEPQENAQEPN